MVFTNAPISAQSGLRSRTSRVNPAGSRRDVQTVECKNNRNCSNAVNQPKSHGSHLILRPARRSNDHERHRA